MFILIKQQNYYKINNFKPDCVLSKMYITLLEQLSIIITKWKTVVTPKMNILNILPYDV